MPRLSNERFCAISEKCSIQATAPGIPEVAFDVGGPRDGGNLHELPVNAGGFLTGAAARCFREARPRSLGRFNERSTVSS